MLDTEGWRGGCFVVLVVVVVVVVIDGLLDVCAWPSLQWLCNSIVINQLTNHHYHYHYYDYSIYYARRSCFVAI